MKSEHVIKYFTKELKRELTEEECKLIKVSFGLGEQNMFNQMMDEEYSISPSEETDIKTLNDKLFKSVDESIEKKLTMKYGEVIKSPFK